MFPVHVVAEMVSYVVSSREISLVTPADLARLEARSRRGDVRQSIRLSVVSDNYWPDSLKIGMDRSSSLNLSSTSTIPHTQEIPKTCAQIPTECAEHVRAPQKMSQGRLTLVLSLDNSLSHNLLCSLQCCSTPTITRMY